MAKFNDLTCYERVRDNTFIHIYQQSQIATCICAVHWLPLLCYTHSILTTYMRIAIFASFCTRNNFISILSIENVCLRTWSIEANKLTFNRYFCIKYGNWQSSAKIRQNQPHHRTAYSFILKNSNTRKIVSWVVVFQRWK